LQNKEVFHLIKSLTDKQSNNGTDKSKTSKK